MARFAAGGSNIFRGWTAQQQRRKRKTEQDNSGLILQSSDAMTIMSSDGMTIKTQE